MNLLRISQLRIAHAKTSYYVVEARKASKQTENGSSISIGKAAGKADGT